MLTTATSVAVLLLILGGLLTRLLHFSAGALGIASGIVLLIIAVSMILSPHLDENRMLVTEKVFGFLLAALAVQLALDGLPDVG